MRRNDDHNHNNNRGHQANARASDRRNKNIIPRKKSGSDESAEGVEAQNINANAVSKTTPIS
jgi:hypothetical protein